MCNPPRNNKLKSKKYDSMKKKKKVRIYDNTIQFGTKYDINQVL